MAKLTDRQKKKIIADYVETQNYSETARRNKTTDTTVRRILKSNGAVLEKVEQKKEQNTQDVLAYLDSKVDSLKRFGDYIMDERLDPVQNKGKLDEMPIRDIIQAYGVLTDKMLRSKEITSKNSTVHLQVSEDSNIVEAIKSTAPVLFDDDPELVDEFAEEEMEDE